MNAFANVTSSYYFNCLELFKFEIQLNSYKLIELIRKFDIKLKFIYMRT